MRSIRLSSVKVLQPLRWTTSVFFFFLAIEKALFLQRYGLEPYEEVVVIFNLPAVLGYYGVVALGIEILIAVGLWVRSVFKSAIIMMSAMTIVGIGLSIWSLIFKLQSDCGCGLMGDNEYVVLIQKVLILGVLYVLLRNKKTLFESD